MGKDKYKKLASDPKMISGIHNYCNKWCERCKFTKRCAVGVMEAEDRRAPKSLDPNNPEFFKKLHGIFADTFELIREMAKENGVDVDAPIPEEYWIQKEQRDKDTREHICAKASKKYMEMVRKWLDESSKDFESKTAELIKKATLKLPGTVPEKEALEIKDAVAVIIWYHTVIHVKLMRALHQIFEDELEILEDFPKDYDGSAKIALVSIEESLKAWEMLLKHFGSREDEILKMLTHLQKLLRRTELEFPNARSFKRPGFDD